jgi:succinyl-diaminopimelate desuccinylase
MAMPAEFAPLVDKYVDPDEAVAICQALVRAPSENPPGDEREVARATEKILDDLGLDCSFVEPLPARVSTISTWGEGTAKTLLFNGHYDVVPVGDRTAWNHPPFSATVENGRLYGRGSTDMKAGIAACIAAVSALQRANFEPDGKVLMHLVADEEALGTHGTRYLVEHGHCEGATEALIGEPTAMHLVTAERGAVWLRIATDGVSAHGSTPRLGTNAIEHMAHVIDAVSGMRFRELHETLGAPTINIGTIRGGSKVNMVPDYCEIEIDRRTLPGETNEEIAAEFESALDALREHSPELRVRVIIDDFAEASQTPEGTSLVALLDEARTAFGIDGSEVGYAGATDARFLINQGKIPSIVFGPGDPLLAHTVDEYVEISQLVQATKAYAYAFARFLSRDQ